MPRNKGWFRLYDRMVDSPEILELDDTEFRLLVSLWALASSAGQDGSLPGFRPASIQRRVMPHCAVDAISNMIDHFKALGLIEGDAGGYRICRWEQHQYEYPSKFPSRRRKEIDEVIANSAEAIEKPEKGVGESSGRNGEGMGNSSGSVRQIDPEAEADPEEDLKNATTTPREPKVADSDAAPDNLLDRAMQYLTGAQQHPVGFSPIETQQIQRSLAVVGHDFPAWQRVVETAVAVHAKNHPNKRIRTFHYFVGPFEDLAEAQEARQAPRQAAMERIRAAPPIPGYSDPNQETLKLMTAAFEAAQPRKESG